TRRTMWLRLVRAALYRGFANPHGLASSDARRIFHALPNTIRRYSRLKICATSDRPFQLHPNRTRISTTMSTRDYSLADEHFDKSPHIFAYDHCRDDVRRSEWFSIRS